MGQRRLTDWTRAVSPDIWDLVAAAWVKLGGFRMGARDTIRHAAYTPNPVPYRGWLN